MNQGLLQNTTASGASIILGTLMIAFREQHDSETLFKLGAVLWVFGVGMGIGGVTQSA